MQTNLDINEKYELLIATLNMVLIPIKEINISYLDTVQYCLDELEGDYYTFLHENSVSELCKAGMVSDVASIIIENIRSKIDNIGGDKWNIEDFFNDMSWQEIRKLIIDLYSTNLNEI